MITKEQITKFAPATAPKADSLVLAINKAIDKFNINTPRRVRYFLSQAYFETQGFSAWIENLSYKTADRLVIVWPTRFTANASDTTKAFAPNFINNPEKLANLVYANRNGNGDVASGDGWKYIGRGAFHLTGKKNYADASHALYEDDRLVAQPSLVQEYEAGLLTAGWFWDTRSLNNLADIDSFTKVTEIINGSAATVPDRLVVLNKANLIF